MNISKDLLARIIYTLKQIDVRGYDSMDKLVGTVTLLERIAESAEQKEQTETEGQEES